jgi:hypothetical protein
MSPTSVAAARLCPKATSSLLFSTLQYKDMESPYTPLLYPPSRREPSSTRLSTAFLSGILVLVVLNCLLTAEAILSTYQIQFAVRRS